MNTLKSTLIETKVGPMVAVADDNFLYFLEFEGSKYLERGLKRLKEETKSMIVPGTTPILQSIKDELDQYFKGTLREFKTPLSTLGTPFQKAVWDALQKIPYGKTCSYAQLATAIDKPTAFRAVANANSVNQITIVIPCHRVINANGDLCGYAGGIDRKIKLIEHERKLSNE